MRWMIKAFHYNSEIELDEKLISNIAVLKDPSFATSHTPLQFSCFTELRYVTFLCLSIRTLLSQC